MCALTVVADHIGCHEFIDAPETVCALWVMTSAREAFAAGAALGWGPETGWDATRLKRSWVRADTKSMSGSADTAIVRPGDGAPAAAGAGSLPGVWVSAWRMVKFAVAVALLPACAGLTLAFREYFWGYGTQARVAAVGWPVLLKWFLVGVGGFGALAILLWRPVVVYVFGHELMHALATWSCLGKVSNLQASTAGGQVTTSKSNTLIRLAPYCVPLYAILAASVYSALDAWWRPLNAPGLLAGLLGFALAFHVGFTLWSLKRGQPDLKPDGWFFSVVVIFLVNVLVVAAVVGLALAGRPGGAWEAVREVWTAGYAESAKLYGELYVFLRRMVVR